MTAWPLLRRAPPDSIRLQERPRGPVLLKSIRRFCPACVSAQAHPQSPPPVADIQPARPSPVAAPRDFWQWCRRGTTPPAQSRQQHHFPGPKACTVSQHGLAVTCSGHATAALLSCIVGNLDPAPRGTLGKNPVRCGVVPFRRVFENRRRIVFAAIPKCTGLVAYLVCQHLFLMPHRCTPAVPHLRICPSPRNAGKRLFMQNTTAAALHWFVPAKA